MSSMNAAGAASAASPGVQLLRELRGSERASFNEVADHIVDFGSRHPEARPILDDFASFLAAVEFRPHTHDGAGATLEYDDT